MTRYLLLFDSYGQVFAGRPLWREDGSVFCICCWPSPAQSFSGPESLGNRDHILLSQIWDFPFRRLLRLAGSRWKYSTPPPRGWGISHYCPLLITSRHGPQRTPRSSVACVSFATGTCLPSRSLATVVYSCLLRICYPATDAAPLPVSRPLPRNECCFRAVSQLRLFLWLHSSCFQ
jgi:hypothetical protein